MEPIKVRSIDLSYDDYVKTNPRKSKSYLKKKDYKNIIIEFLQNVMEHIIITGEFVEFPSYMGYLQAVRYKSSKPTIDYQTTRRLYWKENKNNPDSKKTIEQKFLATNGYKVIIRWTRKGTKSRSFKNSKFISFKPTRSNIRPYKDQWNARVQLFPYFKEKMWNKYIEI